MTIELYVSDLDGTLLNRYHRSDSEIDGTIDAVLEKGKYFAIATGRHLHANHRIGLTFLDRPIFKICMNGAIVYDPYGNVMVQHCIPETIVEALEKQFPTVSFEWITQDGVYVQRSKWQHFKAMIKGNMTLRHVIKHLVALSKGKYYYNVQQIPKQHILKIDTCVSDESTRQKMRDFLAKYQAQITDAGYRHDIFEITASQANKKEAVLVVLQSLNLSESQVAVYGNDLNDVSMLEYFANSYVPDDSVSQAQQVATHILGSSKDHSVARHIRSTLLQ